MPFKQYTLVLDPVVHTDGTTSYYTRTVQHPAGWGFTTGPWASYREAAAFAASLNA